MRLRSGRVVLPVIKSHKRLLPSIKYTKKRSNQSLLTPELYLVIIQTALERPDVSLRQILSYKRVCKFWEKHVKKTFLCDNKSRSRLLRVAATKNEEIGSMDVFALLEQRYSLWFNDIENDSIGMFDTFLKSMSQDRIKEVFQYTVDCKRSELWDMLVDIFGTEVVPYPFL